MEEHPVSGSICPDEGHSCLTPRNEQRDIKQTFVMVYLSLCYGPKSAKSEEPDTSVMPAPQGTVCARIQIRGRSFAGRIESGTVSLVRDTIVVGLTAGFRKSAPGHAILSGRDYIHIFII